MKRTPGNIILAALAIWTVSCACAQSPAQHDLQSADWFQNVYTSRPYCLKKNDGTKYYIVIKQDRMLNNVYAEYVDAFAYRNGKKVVVSAYDGGDDLDDCGMEVQYRVCLHSLANGRNPTRRIIYDKRKRILCVPLDNGTEKCSTWSKYYVVYKFDGEMFFPVYDKDQSYFMWPFEISEL